MKEIKYKKEYRACLLTMLFVVFCWVPDILQAQNPYLPGTAFIPDGEPHVFDYQGEKRVFVYGSRDERVTSYCGYGHDVWSAPVNDLSKWTNHGEIFNVKQVWDIGYGIKEEQAFGAPDCVYNPVLKKYYLYMFFLTMYKMDGKEGPLPGSPNYVEGFGDNGPTCVMAESDSPVGPFINPVMCDWPAANTTGVSDPSVLVVKQDDGSVRVFAFWGMQYGDRWAEIDPNDMHTIINPKTKKPNIDRRTQGTYRYAYYKTLNNPALNKYSTFYEASSIKQIAKDKFVFIYSANELLCALSYCYSNSPEGPWIYGGKIINNGINWPFGNNHGSIAQIEGQWYVFYHKKTNNDYSRQAMIEPIKVNIEDDKVIIPQVEMTSQGIYSNGLDAFRQYNINTVCYLTNGAYIDGGKRNPDGLNPLVGIDQKKTVIGFKYLNFGPTKIVDKDNLKIKLNTMIIHPNSKVTIQVALKTDANDSTKRVNLATFNLNEFIKADGFYHEVALPISGINDNKKLNAIGGLKGQLALFMVFNDKGSEVCRLKEFGFAEGTSLTPNPLRSVNIDNKIKNGTISAIPAKGRSGESIKLTIVPKFGYELKSLVAKGPRGTVFNLSQNAKGPYTPTSYNFSMPEQEVNIVARFVLIQKK